MQRINGNLIDTKNLKKRTISAITYLLTLPDNTKVSAGDVAGYIAGYMGNCAEPKDEIEIIR